ncbi:hypothetical protein MTO96_021797 [Rhipicephalus appendiculatus]
MPTLSGLHLPSSSPTGTGGVAAPGTCQPSTTVRITVMGAARVGKSSLIQQFLYGRVPKQHNATVEELHRRDYGAANGGRHRLTLELLDTSGSYQFPAMRQLAITTAQAFILVYAIDDMESFEEVRRLRSEIQEARAELGKGMPPVVIVGNKSGPGVQTHRGLRGCGDRGHNRLGTRLRRVLGPRRSQRDTSLSRSSHAEQTSRRSSPTQTGGDSRALPRSTHTRGCTAMEPRGTAASSRELSIMDLYV